MSTHFIQALEREISRSQHHRYGIENFDEHRFGKYTEPVKPKSSAWKKIKNAVKTALPISHTGMPAMRHAEKFARLYEALPQKDRDLLVSLLAYRHLGYQKVKLPRNTEAYWKLFATAAAMEDKEDSYDPHFLHFILSKFDLNPIVLDIKLYHVGLGIVTNILLEQYAYKVQGNNFIEVEKNDVVLDIGACIGDTALYFANKTTEGGKVYSFEFIPSNLKLLHMNVDLNPHFKPVIEVVERPVSNRSNDTIYYQDHGPASRIFSTSFKDQTGSTTTISIDDFVLQNNIKKVNFIKMDIEGAEMQALHGAVETIRRFRPRLAIAIYHSLDDMADIPNWILDLDMGYEIFLDHFTIHEEETICFAKVK